MEKRLVDGRWVAIRESRTKSGGLVSVRTDITGRKQAEEALRISEKRTRAVVDNIIDGIITFDDTGIIRSVNPAAQQIFDYVSDAMIGQPVSMLVPETPNNALSRQQDYDLTAISNRFTGKTQELEGRRANGVHFPLELAVSEMDTHQGSLFVGIFRDISDRKEMDRLKREFVSTVSHELRTPLTAIQGALGLISGGVAGAVSSNAAALISIAEKNSKRLNNLVNDILDIEKVESGKIEYQFGDVELDRLIEQSVADNRHYSEKFSVNFKFVGAASNTKVRADPARLQQVMANLLSNAAKFSIPESVVEVKAERNGDTARVSVIDYGSGILESFTDRIFEKFSQADSSNERTQGGTSLGLSISRAIIEQHNGSIGSDAGREDGATFYFDLPAL
jgi:PAS domain S-box-containing protein